MSTSPITTVSLKTGKTYSGRRRGPKRKPKDILEELLELGVTRPYVAQKLKEVFEEGDAKEKLTASRMYLALTGEIKDERSGAGTVINTGPTMVIVGASEARMKALRAALPPLSPEQAEEERAARANERLALLRRGELPPLPSKSQAKWVEDAEQAIDLQSSAAECSRQATPREGRCADSEGS